MNTTKTAPIDGFTDSTSLLETPDALIERAAQDGFLYFRQLLPVEPIMELRRQMLEVLDRHGWLKAGVDVMDGVADLEAIAAMNVVPEIRSLGVTQAIYRDVQMLELFHRLPHHPKLLKLYETLFQGAVLPHPRHIARVLVPAPGAAPTPPHQDYVYIQGSHQFWTLWFPLGDCPVELGGLSVLRGSHNEPVLDVTAAPGAGGKESMLCEHDYEWVQGDYTAGDIITFPSHLLHRGLPNQLGDRIRLSCDLRYQPAEVEVEDKSLEPHVGVATWDEIYADWKQDDLKYYWRDLSLKRSPWDPSLVEGKERIC